MPAHLVVADVAAPVIDDADRHHVERVLRIRAGEPVTVTDGRGGLRSCRLGPGLALEAVDEPGFVARPTPPVAIGFSLLKGDRSAWVVQKLTELAVDRIVPFVSERTIVRRVDVGRLRRVAREALMQSRGAWLPDVDDVVPFAEVPTTAAVALPAAAAGPSLALSTVLVGPEGGFTPAEASGREAVSLGPTVLRSETAALVAGALLTGLRARIVAEIRRP